MSSFASLNSKRTLVSRGGLSQSFLKSLWGLVKWLRFLLCSKYFIRIDRYYCYLSGCGASELFLFLEEDFCFLGDSIDGGLQKLKWL